jgi:hypothetical protein
MRDFENYMGTNNYTRYPAYYDLMIDSSVTAYKHWINVTCELYKTKSSN